MKIGFYLGVIFVIFALICAAGLSFYMYSSSTDLTRSLVLNQLSTAAESRAHTIETYLLLNNEMLRLTTTRTVLRERILAFNTYHDENMRALLVGMLHDSKNGVEGVERLSVIGIDGTVIASSSEEFIGKDESNKDFFVKGKDVDGAYFVNENGVQKLFFSGPFILNGKVIGVGLSVANLEYLKEIVQLRSGLGETGEILLVSKDQNGLNYIFDRRYESQALDLGETSKEFAAPAKAATEGNETVFLDALDYRGVKVVAATHYIASAKLGIVAKIDYVEAIGSNFSILFNALITGLIIFGVILLAISFVISRMVARQILQLSKGVEEITKGNLEVQLKRSNIDEIQNLTDSLNRILASMKLAILRIGLSKQDLGLGEAIKAKEEAVDRYKLIYTASSDALMTLEPPTGKFTSANPATLKLFDAKNEDEFKSKGPGDVSPKKQPNGVLSSVLAKTNIETAMKNGSSSFEWVHKKLTGEEFPAHVLLSRFELNGKQVLQATVHDLTFEKKAQCELKESEENFKKIFDDAPEAMYLSDLKGNFVDGNKAAQKLIGYAKKDLLGKNFLEVNLISKRDIPRGIKWLAINAAGKSTGPDKINLIRKDGSAILVEISSQPLTLSGKKLALGSLHIIDNKK